MAAAQGDDGGITQEIVSRHGHSTQVESQQLVAVLHALREVIASEGLPLTPTSFFAAGMSALEKTETRSSAQVTLAMCTLLGVVLPRVPNAVLRSKFVGATQLVVSIINEQRQQAPCVKAALLVLSQLLSALDPNPEAWPSAAGPWTALVSFLTDARAKVRKRAAAGVIEVLAPLQTHPAALSHASDVLAKLSTTILAGPELAARAAAAASNKQRAAAEEAITVAVSDALHLMSTLKAALPLMSSAPTKAVVDGLFKLLPLRQPLLTRQTIDVLANLLSASTTHLTPATLADILTVLLDAGDVLWERKDADVVLQLVWLLEGGCLRLADVGPQLCAARLPHVMNTLVPLLAAPQEGVRHGTSMALKNLVQGCIDPSMVAAAVAAPQQSVPLKSCMASLASALTARYQDGWLLAVPVIGEVLEVVGQHRPPAASSSKPNAAAAAAAAADSALARVVSPLLHPLAALVAGQEDASAATAMGDVTAPAEVVEAASSALGTALRSLGPAIVLRVLPLNIQEQLSGQQSATEPRTWLLPLMRKHVCGCTLAFWGQELLPLARGLAKTSAAAATVGNASLAHSCHVLELQVWATLPAFMSWATDLPTAFPQYAKDMAGAFSARDDLRAWVCTALERSALQVRQVLRTSPEHHHLTGFADPLGSGADAEEEDDGEEYGVKPARSVASMARSRRPGSTGAAGKQEGGEHHSVPPSSYTLAVAVEAVGALRALSPSWMAALCKVFVELPSESRGNVARAISAYAAIADPAAVAKVFRTAIERLLKVMADAAAELPPRDMITQGGENPAQRRASFTELALCLASGIPDEALDTLLKAAKPCLTEQDASLQKKAYKVLAYLCNARPTFLQSHLGELLTLVLGGTATSLSAAKRYRLRCIKPLILALAAGHGTIAPELLQSLAHNNDGSDTDNDEGDDDAHANMDSSSDDEQPNVKAAKSKARKAAAAAAAAHKGACVNGTAVPATADEQRKQVISMLVSELMLCCKESNKKTRAAAYELLVQIAHAMDDLEPLRYPDAEGMATEEHSAAPGMPEGGLATLFSMIMAGLAGQTPHMISASVMALARLLYEFAGSLQPLVPQLLPAVLMLLRTRSREVVKSVLGFLKVCVVRMPVDMLAANMEDMLQGMLLWAADSKNKFKLKVRMIIERLAKRCGFDAVAKHIPESDAKLLTHIRKEHNRKVRRRAGGSQDGDGDAHQDVDGKSVKSAGQSSKARTARASEWAHTEIFSDDADDEEQGDTDHMSLKSGKGGRGGAATARTALRGRRDARAGTSARLQEGADEPMDLLDMATARHLVKTAAGTRQKQREQPEDTYQRDPEGRMVIDDEDAMERQRAMKRKRRGADDFDSEDSDFDDLRDVAGLDAAVRDANKSSAVQRAMSVKSAGARSMGDKSVGARSQGGQSTGGASQKKGPSLHSGDRFKAKGSTGGDVKGRAKVDPYAYWQFDRKMLNRRPAKKRQASKSLGGVLGAAQEGAARGAKAKARAASKRARNN